MRTKQELSFASCATLKKALALALKTKHSVIWKVDNIVLGKVLPSGVVEFKPLGNNINLTA